VGSRAGLDVVGKRKIENVGLFSNYTALQTGKPCTSLQPQIKRHLTSSNPDKFIGKILEGRASIFYIGNRSRPYPAILITGLYQRVT
jgi:hypothetical protein